MNKENYNYIVLGGEHYNPLGIVRSLGEKNLKPIGVVVRNKKHKVTSASKYLSKLFFVENLNEGLDLILQTYGKDEKKSIIYTSDDIGAELLDSKYDEISKYGKFIFFNAGSGNNIKKFMNKKNILEIAERNELNVLKAATIKKGELNHGLKYPILTKVVMPNKDGWKNDSIVCNTEQDLIEAYKVIQSEDLLVQEYLHKKNEYCIEGFSINHGSKIFLTIASSYNYLLPNSYSFDMTVQNFSRMEILPKLESVFKEIGYEGIFEIEFLVDKDDNLYFSEINFRNSTWSYASTKAGMNMPFLWAEGMIDGEIPSDWKKQLPENFRAIVEYADFKHRVLGHKENIFKWFHKLMKADCLYYYSKEDKKPFFKYIFR